MTSIAPQDPISDAPEAVAAAPTKPAPVIIAYDPDTGEAGKADTYEIAVAASPAVQALIAVFPAEGELLQMVMGKENRGSTTEFEKIGEPAPVKYNGMQVLSAFYLDNVRVDFANVWPCALLAWQDDVNSLLHGYYTCVCRPGEEQEVFAAMYKQMQRNTEKLEQKPAQSEPDPQELERRKAQELRENLANFHGSEQFTRFNPMICPKVITSEGGLYLAENAGAYWLLEYIGLRCNSREFPKIKAEEFQVWKLKVDLAKHSAVISCEDGNHNEVFSEAIEFTSFPLDEIELWCEPNERGGMTIYLPGEH